MLHQLVSVSAIESYDTLASHIPSWMLVKGEPCYPPTFMSTLNSAIISFDALAAMLPDWMLGSEASFNDPASPELLVEDTSSIIQSPSQIVFKRMKRDGKRKSRAVSSSSSPDAPKPACDHCGKKTGLIFTCRDGDECPTKAKVHMECIGRKHAPKSGKWRCPACKKRHADLLVLEKNTSKLMNLEASQSDDCNMSQGHEGEDESQGSLNEFINDDSSGSSDIDDGPAEDASCEGTGLLQSRRCPSSSAGGGQEQQQRLSRPDMQSM